MNRKNSIAALTATNDVLIAGALGSSETTAVTAPGTATQVFIAKMESAACMSLKEPLAMTIMLAEEQ